MTISLTLPPLMSDEAATGPAMDHACLKAIQGCDAGLVVHHLSANTLDAALVFAPEVALKNAMAMLPLCGIGFQNALGALAPPEVAVHLGWDGTIYINGAACGQFNVASSTQNPDTIPDWLVVGFTLPLWPEDGNDGGISPNATTLYAEGCVDVQAPDLLEAFARHTLNWIGRWEDTGTKALHDEWRGLAHRIGEEAIQNGQSGTFVGVDENFGMLLRDQDTTHLIPLTSLLEATP
jgi:biotin-(acetyl-CoA carboxylase) ligase